MAVLTFGEFRLDTINKRLWRGMQPVDLGGVNLNVLCYMVERSVDSSGNASEGHLVTKRELREVVWRDVKVSEETLRSCMSTIRKALSDDSQQPRYIQTQNREGWRFIPKVVVSQQQTLAPGRSPPPPSAAYDPGWYVERLDEERGILGCIEYPSRPVVVYGPQGCGKSALISRALETAVKSCALSSRIIRISLRALSEDHLGSVEAMLQELGRLLLDPNEESPEQTQATLTKFWAKTYDSMLKLKRLVRSEVLQPDQVVYLVLANAERLAPWRFQSAFFDMLRAWQEAEGLSGLRLIVETAIPPRLFSLGGNSPLWTKSRRIPVAGLDTAQITHLAELYGLRPTAVACTQLGELVGGLAMLCRLALFHAAVKKLTLDELMQSYRPTSRSFGPFAEHLEDIQQWLEHQQKAARSSPMDKGISFKLLKEAAQGISLSNEEAWPLIRKGLLVETEVSGEYRLRCRLYEDFFATRAS